MVEYGFEVGSGKCSGKYCLNHKTIKDFDDIMNKATKFGTKLRDSSIYAYRKASCHPTIKEHVAPRVEWVWQLFPFNIITYFNPICILPTLLVDFISGVLCWCCWIPWQMCVVVPWNTTWAIVISFVVVVFVITMIGIGFALTAGASVIWFGWLGMQGALALVFSFFGLFIAFFTTGGFATGGCIIFGPFIFVGMVIAAFISTLGF